MAMAKDAGEAGRHRESTVVAMETLALTGTRLQGVTMVTAREILFTVRSHGSPGWTVVTVGTGGGRREEQLPWLRGGCVTDGKEPRG